MPEVDLNRFPSRSELLFDEEGNPFFAFIQRRKEGHVMIVDMDRTLRWREYLRLKAEGA